MLVSRTQNCPAVLQTDRSDTTSEISSQTVVELPLAGYRNYQSMINLVPGATPAALQNSVGASPQRSLTTYFAEIAAAASGGFASQGSLRSTGGGSGFEHAPSASTSQPSARALIATLRRSGPS